MTNTSTTSDRRSAPIDVALFFRRHWDLLLTGLVAIPLVNFSVFIAGEFIADRWKLSNFYAAVFDWSSIQGAFLFGIYAFVLSRSEPFIRAIANTRAFAQMRGFVRRTVYFAMGLTVITMPMLVAAPPMTEGGLRDTGYILFAGYALATFYMFVRFGRVLRIFTMLERPGD